MTTPTNKKICAICDTRLGHYTDANGKQWWELECHIDNMLNTNFVKYVCCGLCSLDRMKQKTFEKERELDNFIKNNIPTIDLIE